MLKKIIYISLIIIVLLVSGTFLFLFELGGFEEIVQKQLSESFKEQSDIKFTIGEINGNILSGIELKSLSIFYDDSASSYRLIYFPKITAAYSFSNLWDRKYIFDYLTIDSAEIMLKKDSTGAMMIPDFSKKTDTESSGIILSMLAVDELIINNLNFKFIDNKDTLLVNDFNFRAGIKLTENTYSLELKSLAFQSNQEKYFLESAEGKLTYHNKTLVFQDVSLSSDKTKMKFNGNVSFEDILKGNVEFVIDNIDINDVTQFTGAKLNGEVDLNGNISFEGAKFNGSVDIGGKFFSVSFQNIYTDFNYADKYLSFDTIYGTFLGNCKVDGSGAIDFTKPEKTYLVSADLRNFNLKNMVNNSFESDLSGHIELSGRAFKKERMLIDIDADLYESAFDKYPIHSAKGMMSITTDSIMFSDYFRIDYFENRFFVNGKVEYRNDIDLAIIANLDNLDRYRGKLFIDQPGGRGYGEATLTGKTAFPDLSGYFISDSIWIYGLYSDSLYSTFDIDRFLTGKQGKVEVDFFSGQAWSLPFDTAKAIITIDSNLVFIDTANIRNELAVMTSKGYLDYGEYPFQVHLDTLNINLFDRTFSNEYEIEFLVDTLGFDFLQAVIKSEDALLSSVGRVNFDESMDMAILIKQVDIAPWVKLFEGSYDLGGVLSCDGRLAGNFLKPEIKVDGTIDSLEYRDLILGNMTASLNYSDYILSVDSVVIFSDPGLYYGNGYFPIDLAFTSANIDRLPDKPMDFRVTAQDNRFDLVSLILPSVEQLDGDFYSNIRLSGTSQEPHLEGLATIINGRLKYFDLEHPIFVDTATAIMRDNLIIIENMEMYSTENKKRGGKKRYANLEGNIVVNSFDNLFYDLDVEIKKDFPFAYELDDIRGKLEGELHIEGDTPPLVTGDITLLTMRYLVNFAEPDEGSPIMMALSGENTWDLDINIDILSNYWIKNEDIDAEFSGLVKLLRDDGQYRFIGEMEIVRGRGYLFDKTFRLEQGGLVLFEGEERFNPRLDFIGYTRVPGLSQAAFEENETRDLIELGVHVTGTLDTADINPVDGSTFSKEDIIPLIVANYYSGDTTSSTGQFEERFTGILSSQVSQIGARQLNELGVGVETFEIEPYSGTLANPLSTRITVGFYTTQGLYVYGKSQLSGQSGQEVGFEYRFNKAFLVEGRRDEEELYHLNLKLHLEF